MQEKLENDMSLNNPKISIGLPVYNGEKFIRKCIESILEQTNRNFELIISDNASTDSTPDICQEFSIKDSRIKFVRQDENMGQNWNYNFLLEKAIGKYFVWVAADTIILPDFIEKSINLLESEKKIVGCISKIRIDQNYVDKFKKEKQILKKFGLVYRPYDTLPITGNYTERIRKYLEHFPWEMFYAVYRTRQLRESFVQDFFVGSDASLVLNLLRHGEIQVINEFLIESFPFGGSFTYKYYKDFMPFYPLTKWCIDNLGWRIFFRNIDHFFRLSLDGMIIQFTSIYKNLKKI